MRYNIIQVRISSAGRGFLTFWQSINWWIDSEIVIMFCIVRFFGHIICSRDGGRNMYRGIEERIEVGLFAEKDVWQTDKCFGTDVI